MSLSIQLLEKNSTQFHVWDIGKLFPYGKLEKRENDEAKKKRKEEEK